MPECLSHKALLEVCHPFFYTEHILCMIFKNVHLHSKFYQLFSCEAITKESLPRLYNNFAQIWSLCIPRTGKILGQIHQVFFLDPPLSFEILPILLFSTFLYL